MDDLMFCNCGWGQIGLWHRGQRKCPFTVTAEAAMDGSVFGYQASTGGSQENTASIGACRSQTLGTAPSPSSFISQTGSFRQPKRRQSASADEGLGQEDLDDEEHVKVSRSGAEAMFMRKQPTQKILSAWIAM